MTRWAAKPDWFRPDPATAIEAREWMDPCEACGGQVTGFDAETITVRDNPDSVISIPPPGGCPAEDDPDADCRCTVIINPAPNPLLDTTHVVGVVYTLRPCGHQARHVRVYRETRPAPGTLGELMADWGRLVTEPAGPDPPPSFTCPRCGRTSWHPRDAEEGYCGACHDWTGPGRR